MATKEIVRGLLTTLCEIHQRKTSDVLLNEYHRAFKPYSDEQVRKAGYKTIDEYQFFPKPAHIIERIEVNTMDNQGQVKYSRIVCTGCGRLTGCIKDHEEPWLCCECYSGISKAEISGRFQALFNVMDKGFPEGIDTPEKRFDYIKTKARDVMGTQREVVI